MTSGASKVAASASWPNDAARLGAPRWAVPIVPYLELAVGALMLVGVGWPIVPLVAIGLLVAFSALLVINLRRGRRPACACFGRWSSKPITWRDVGRNVLLMIIAVLSLLR